MVPRDLTPRLRRAAAQFPAVTLTGPRQSGKSTLCRAVFPDHPYANLEAPDIRAFATDDPRAFLAQFPRGAVIDEVQRAPELPSYLQGLIDTNPAPGRWILTGSQNLALLESVGQSLAGRTAILHLLPLARSEVEQFERHPKSLEESLVAGGYPRIFDQGLDPSDWLRAYIAAYVERDVRTISNIGDLATFQRFVALCAGRTSQLLNYSALASDCGVTQPTAKRWMSVLETSYIAFPLQPYSRNIGKRLIKMPKLHFYDTGLLCWLLGIRGADQLRTHPMRGAIFETWVVSEILKHRANHGETRGLSYYRDHNGVEADLIVEQADRLSIVEAKANRTATKNLFDGAARVRKALGEQANASATVVYAGDERQERTNATLVPWNQLNSADWT